MLKGMDTIAFNLRDKAHAPATYQMEHLDFLQDNLSRHHQLVEPLKTSPPPAAPPKTTTGKRRGNTSRDLFAPENYSSSRDINSTRRGSTDFVVCQVQKDDQHLLDEHLKSCTLANPVPQLLSYGLCDKSFVAESGLQQHIANRHYVCPVCNQNFRTAYQPMGHQRASAHCFCAEHRQASKNEAALKAHDRSIQHVTYFECLLCDRAFKTQQGLFDQVNDYKHSEIDAAMNSNARTVETAGEANLYCESCDRKFVHIGAYHQHKHPVKHKPLSKLSCPLSERCDRIFTSPSALLFHLESGGCASGMTRLALSGLIHKHDNTRHINYEQNDTADTYAQLVLAYLMKPCNF